MDGNKALLMLSDIVYRSSPNIFIILYIFQLFQIFLYKININLRIVKGLFTVSVCTSDPPCKYGNAWFTTLNPIPPPYSFFFITQKVLVWGWFSDFSYIPKALPLCLKPGFNTNCHESSGTLPESLLLPITN